MLGAIRVNDAPFFPLLIRLFFDLFESTELHVSKIRDLSKMFKLDLHLRDRNKKLVFENKPGEVYVGRGEPSWPGSDRPDPELEFPRTQDFP